MDKIKNYTIALLTGLLVLSLFTQSAQSAPAKSKEAKAAEYLVCMTETVADGNQLAQPSITSYINVAAKACAIFRP